ncbi:hypothetical protein KDW_27960 [Dictyobacter vulcani]|uniref:DUF3987 domain-containing protein n=1 Tax=Dictyobacter vulcani TaxID=2607529 RepID=A0A5J4KGP0_9CHLR|nr:DUF3987 domain-containing protein [Dictyobacter vulcani]GER88634.1 hypothetical protein KDW_27960 [Dictyobacter vulcani]
MMINESKNGHVHSQRSQVRAYIQQLRKGQRPSVRPPLGIWEATVQNIERAYEKCQGDVQKLEVVLEALAHQHPSLAELLAPLIPTVEEIAREEQAQTDFPMLPPEACLPVELGRDACYFLDIYEQFSREASPEGYDGFHAFCGIWLLSVVAARRVYLPFNTKRIHTNVMIALCGRTSLFAKSTTARVAKEILYAAGLGHLLGPDRATPAKLLSDMTGKLLPPNYGDLPIEKQEQLRSRLAQAGQRGLFFDEFGKFMQGMLKRGSMTSDFAELFLTLDACPPEYENSTIARGGEPIQKPYLSLLGSMTPSNLRESARTGSDFWTEGFGARVSFVTAPIDQYKDQPLHPTELAIPEELIHTLVQWHHRLGVPDCQIIQLEEESSKGKGQVRYTIERGELSENVCSITHEAYNAWKRYRSALKGMLISFPGEDFHGSYTRLPETAMRMAILMASLENENHIELRHWAKAQDLAEKLRLNLHELYRQINAPQSSSDLARLEDEIHRTLTHLNSRGVGCISVSQLKNSYLKAYSLKDLREAMESMVMAGVLYKEVTPHATGGKYSIATAQI